MMCAHDPRKGVYINALPTRRSAAGPAAADLVLTLKRLLYRVVSVTVRLIS